MVRHCAMCSPLSMFANNALLGGGVWIREQIKIKRRSKALQALMAILDISQMLHVENFMPRCWQDSNPLVCSTECINSLDEASQSSDACLYHDVLQLALTAHYLGTSHYVLQLVLTAHYLGTSHYVLQLVHTAHYMSKTGDRLGKIVTSMGEASFNLDLSAPLFLIGRVLGSKLGRSLRMAVQLNDCCPHIFPLIAAGGVYPCCGDDQTGKGSHPSIWLLIFITSLVAWVL